MGTVDKVALAVLVFPVATLIFWPVGIWLYQWRGGIGDFRRKTTGYFLSSGALAACLPGGAALLIARFVPLPSIAGYVYGGLLAVAGIIGGVNTLSKLTTLTVGISVGEVLARRDAHQLRTQRRSNDQRKK